jgi:hypothetical protein
VADSCECGNELSGSIKCGEFLDWLRTCWDSAPWLVHLLGVNIMLPVSMFFALITIIYNIAG